MRRNRAQAKWWRNLKRSTRIRTNCRPAVRFVPNTVRKLGTIALLISALVPSPAAAASIRLGLGADYWFNGHGEFNFTLAPMASLSRAVSVGARLGVLLVTAPATAGLPLDIQLRISIQQLYIEGSGGPWILFTDSPVRAHGAFGFGLQSGIVSFGVEAGWLDPSALLGARLGLRL